MELAGAPLRPLRERVQDAASVRLDRAFLTLLRTTQRAMQELRERLASEPTLAGGTRTEKRRPRCGT